MTRRMMTVIRVLNLILCVSSAFGMFWCGAEAVHGNYIALLPAVVLGGFAIVNAMLYGGLTYND